MNTRKHLYIISNLINILIGLDILGTFICFIAMITGESAFPFLICAIISISLYFSRVILSAFIEIYEAVVTKDKI